MICRLMVHRPWSDRLIPSVSSTEETGYDHQHRRDNGGLSLYSVRNTEQSVGSSTDRVWGNEMIILSYQGLGLSLHNAPLIDRQM